MKKIYALLQNENVMATLVITTVFIVTALIVFLAINRHW